MIYGLGVVEAAVYTIQLRFAKWALPESRASPVQTLLRT